MEGKRLVDGSSAPMPGIGGGFELKSVFLFKCLAPGKSSCVKKVQIPHSTGHYCLSKELNK